MPLLNFVAYQYLILTPYAKRLLLKKYIGDYWRNLFIQNGLIVIVTYYQTEKPI